MNFKKKIILGLIGVGGLIIPTFTISAVACSPEKASSKIIIKTQPQSLNAFVGQTTNLPTFSVTIENLANVKFTYQWFSNTTKSTTNGVKISGATSNSYTLTSQDLKKAGTTYFYVEIGGIINGIKLLPITSNTAILTVSSLPKITISKQPINKTLTLGTTNLPTFSVEVNNIQGAQFKYQWYSSEINSNTNGTEISKATNASYTVNKFDVSVPQSKYYYVKITGSINGIELTPVFSNTATLTINALPSISIVNNIQNQEVYAKQIFNKPTFSVVVEPIKGAAFTYQWYSNTSNSTSGGTTIRGANYPQYTVTDLDIKVTGTKYYYVKISGIVNGMALKDFYSNVASLTIKSLPKITISREPWDQVAVVGQTTNLPTFLVEVNKIKDVRFEYQWYQNGKYIYGATNSSYQVPASDLKSAGRKRYYVEINGFVNGLSLTNSNSRSALLTINS